MFNATPPKKRPKPAAKTEPKPVVVAKPAKRPPRARPKPAQPMEMATRVVEPVVQLKAPKPVTKPASVAVQVTAPTPVTAPVQVQPTPTKPAIKKMAAVKPTATVTKLTGSSPAEPEPEEEVVIGDLALVYHPLAVTYDMMHRLDASITARGGVVLDSGGGGIKLK